ncbi:hypothetical protein [Streptomyces sp. NPDC050804]|uniref:hypothetical protein n=1 Tax=Streptomyces sp. NPDC050804 TaxID=3154745 RepID=UPI003417B906
MRHGPPIRQQPLLAVLSDFQPPSIRPAVLHDRLFDGEARYAVQTPMESHDSKKRSGSSDGAQTYDTPIT